MTPLRTSGIHHVTAISGEPRPTIGFYSRLLGLRLVKRSVNFDDPGTWHLYFADELGRPGTILTFFPWPGAARGSRGAGQAAAIALAVPPGSLGFWRDRLEAAGLAPLERMRLDQPLLAFDDPDGLPVELVGAAAGRMGPAWPSGPVPTDHAIRGVHSVTLCVEDSGPTAAFLTGTLGLSQAGSSEGRMRFGSGQAGPGAVVDLLVDHGRGGIGAGIIHHIAWRAEGDAAQRAWREKLEAARVGVTPIVERNYFRSIYFREPGGVLFEIATDGPGFTVDEPVDRLGTSLCLPPWLEARRAEIERALPPLD